MDPGPRDVDFGAVFEVAPVPAAIFDFLDGDFHLLTVNSAFRHLWDEENSALVWPSLSTAVRAAHVSGDVHDALFTVHGRSVRYRVRTERVPGSRYIVAQLRAEDGQAADERELRSRIRQLQDLVDNSAALMYVKDLDGRYRIVNDYFSKLFGLRLEDVLGRTDHELFPSPSADIYAAHDQEVLRHGAAVEVEEPFAAIGGDVNRDEDRRWLSIKFPLLDDGGRPYALGAISTDITDRTRAEAAARQAMHEAERANQIKNEFLSRMSHELRTPLNAIIGFAQLLTGTSQTRSIEEGLGHILEAGHHLLELVNDVLDISWIEAGAPGMSVEPISAVEPIHQALEIIRPLAQAQDVEVVSDLHGAMHRTVQADSRRLRQVFLNLLGNAVKFNREQGAIRVRVEARGDRLRYLITDTGHGISDEDRIRLFTPFVRLAAAANAEGSGLGLALSRRLVEEMGGEIGIEHTAPGEGSTFFVELALDEDPADEVIDAVVPAAEPDIAPRSGVEATILLIEDTLANVRLVEGIVASMGNLNLEVAGTGRDGLRKAKKTPPDLVLLDLNLTDMTGGDVVTALRKDAMTSGIPIIVLSADATPARIAQLRQAGVYEYLTKPFDVHSFARTVRAALTS